MPEVTPWWKALRIRREILNAAGQIDDVQMSLFQAVHGLGSSRPLYAEATYYGEITHPTGRLVDLLTEIAVRIGAGDDYTKARSVTRLDQGMGGGKSHACIGAYHLAKDPEGLFRTELGKAVAAQARARVGKDLAADLGRPHVVVLPCDNMTPGAPVKEYDGPAESLYERFLWRLFSKDYALYERYQPFFNDKSQIANALHAVNRPVLVIVDEILDYIGNGLDGAAKPDMAAQDVAFLRAFLDVVNDVPHVAALVVMIASDRDKIALSEAAVRRRDDLSGLLERNGLPATVTEVGDFADILRRRLFDAEPAGEVLAATAAKYRGLLNDPNWVKSVWDAIGSDWRRDWDDQVATCYPFHPMLMNVAKQEWSQVTGFQRVRSTIRIFAASVFALQQRGLAGEWVPDLIGPGDLPLSDSGVREALLGSGLVEDERTIANYRSLAEIEVVNADTRSGTARRQDLDRADAKAAGEPILWLDRNPRASERAATAIFLASIVGTLRPGRGRGASAPEVKAATAAPGGLYTVTDADSVVEELMNPDKGMSAVEVIAGQGNNKPARYYLSTRLTHRMLVNNLRRTITETERDQLISEFTQRLVNTGPFHEHKFVAADLARSATDVLATAGIDDAHKNRLVVLDPSQYSLRNGMEEGTLAALTNAMGLGTGTAQVPVTWASSAVFSVVNTQRRSHIRKIAIEYLAARKALEAPEVQNDPELKRTGTTELNDAKTQLNKALKRAYQHIVYLSQPDPDGERYLDQLTFDDDNLTALDGTLVWKGLADRDKVFDAGQFTAQALVHNLRANDYGRSLADIRRAFYSAPRLPLLNAGDRDLQQAIYDAVKARLVDIVDGVGNPVAVTAPGQVNLASTGLLLAKPIPTTCPSCGQPAHSGNPCATQPDPGAGGGSDPTSANPSGLGGGAAARATSPQSGTSTQPGGGTQPASRDQPKEQQVGFSFTRNLLNDTDSADRLAALLKTLYQALDEREISYLQGTLQIVCAEDIAHRLKSDSEALNLQVNIRDI